MTFDCSECKKGFSRPASLKRHIKHVHGINKVEAFSCESCRQKFSRREYLLRHQRHQHENGASTSTTCSMCGRVFRKDYLKSHESACLRKAVRMQGSVSPWIPPPPRLQIQWTTPLQQDSSTTLALQKEDCGRPTAAVWRPHMKLISQREPDGLHDGASRRDRMMLLVARHFYDLQVKAFNDEMFSDIHHALACGISTDDINHMTTYLLVVPNGRFGTFLTAAAFKGDIRSAQFIIRMGFPWLYPDECVMLSATYMRQHDFICWLLEKTPPKTFTPGVLMRSLVWSMADSDEMPDISLLRSVLVRGVDSNHLLGTIDMYTGDLVSEGLLDVEIVKLLLEFGADVNYENGRFLGGALHRGTLEFTIFLLDSGARADIHLDNFSPFSFDDKPDRSKDFGAKRQLIQRHAARQGVSVDWLRIYEEYEAQEVKQIWNKASNSSEQDFENVLSRIEAIIKYGLSPDDFNAITIAAARADVEPDSPMAWTLLALAVDRRYFMAAHRLVQMGFAAHSRYEALWDEAVTSQDEDLIRLLLSSPLEAGDLDEIAVGTFTRLIASTGFCPINVDLSFLPDESHDWKAELLIAVATSPWSVLTAISEYQHHADFRLWMGKALCVATEYSYPATVQHILDAGAILNTSGLRAALDRAWTQHFRNNRDSVSSRREDIILKASYFLRYARQYSLDPSWLDDYKAEADTLFPEVVRGTT